VLRKLDRREYPDVASLRADVDLIWDNAVLYNGENSWIKKYVDAMRTVSARKFAEVAARPPGVVRKPSVARPSLPSGSQRGVGNVPAMPGTAYFITPQMRLQLLENAIKLQDNERVRLVQMAQSCCPGAVETVAEQRETKIDIDALDPGSFLRLDVHVRRCLAQARAQQRAGAMPGFAATH
jgi:hypothetical protein